MKCRNFAKEEVRKDGLSLYNLEDQNLRDDREIVLLAVRQNGMALHFASKRLKGDLEVVMEAIKESGWALQYVAMELKEDREFMKEVVKQNGMALKLASKELKNDREIVLMAMVQNGSALRFASIELQQEYADLVTTKLKVAKEKQILMVAAREGYASVIRFICQPYANRDNVKGEIKASDKGCSDDSRLVIQSFSVILNELLRFRSASGNMPLHEAAREGHLEACEVLCDEFGAPSKARNFDGKTPEDLARSHVTVRRSISDDSSSCRSGEGDSDFTYHDLKSPHEEVLAYFEDLTNIFRTGGGNGGALNAALCDDRQVTSIAWCQLPLPGLYSLIGTFHSLLIVTVGLSTATASSGQAIYVLEKLDSRKFKKGVFVTHWRDARMKDIDPNPLHALEGIAGQRELHTVSPRQKMKGRVKPGITMRQLYAIAVGEDQTECEYNLFLTLIFPLLPSDASCSDAHQILTQSIC